MTLSRSLRLIIALPPFENMAGMAFQGTRCASSGALATMDKPLRAAKPIERHRTPPAREHEVSACTLPLAPLTVRLDDILGCSVAGNELRCVLARSQPPLVPSRTCRCRPQVDAASPGLPSQTASSPDRLGALLNAGRLLGCLLDALAGAITSRQAAVPAHLEALVGRFFPAATSIAATLPSPDGCWLATLLLRPPTASDLAGSTDTSDGSAPALQLHGPQQQYQHTEQLGAGVCSFQLAAPPTAASLRLMRSFIHQLEARLQMHVVGLIAAADAPAAAAAAAAAGPAAPTTPPALSVLAQQEREQGLPADCFWMSV